MCIAVYRDVVVGPEERNLLGKQRNLRPGNPQIRGRKGKSDSREKRWQAEIGLKKKKKRNWFPCGACTSVRE